MFRILTAALMAAMVGFAMRAGAAEYFVGPDGNRDAEGTREDPWDIYSALSGGQQRVQPGDTIWLLDGIYRNEAALTGEGPNINVEISGAEDDAIIIRGAPGERAIINGDMYVGNADYIWLWDIELTTIPDKEIDRTQVVDNPSDLGAPNGGITIRGGRGQKFINLYIYDNFGGGVGWWLRSQDGLFYGCVIVNNGWRGPRRNHGHCIYTQNDDGVKTMRHNIMKTRYGGGQFTMHAYGSARAWKNNFLVEENIAYAPGSFLIGGGRSSRGIRMLNNYIHGQSARVGYTAPENEDAEVSGNFVADGSLTVIRFKEVVARDNIIVNGNLRFDNCGEVEEENNAIIRERPNQPKAVFLPNEYDDNRAYLAIYNFAGHRAVGVDVANFMEAGEAYRLMDPEDLFGKPVAEGVCEGGRINVPMVDDEGEAKPFAALVLFKNAQ